MKMKIILPLFISIIILTISCNNDAVIPPDEEPTTGVFDFIRGVDISFLPEIETTSTVFKNSDNEQKGVLTIVKEAGCNTVRIRLWHNPITIHSSFGEVKTLAERVRNAGLKVWLCVHYSDTWADPGNQEVPAAWNGLDLATLKDSVTNYTIRIVTEIQPDFIQIGNEINNGFMWTNGQWNPDFHELLKVGCQAVRNTSDSCQIMIHHAGISGVSTFFDNITNNSIDYDLIGISYYPIWHGKDLDALSNTMKSLKSNYNKKVIIAETAYPFTFDWKDWTNNIIGDDSQTLNEYPATPNGQRDFLRKIKEISTDEDNFGFCYWGTEWVAFRGDQATNGSTWENQALFDFNNKAVPAMEVLGE